jgi:hypothetical protein
MNNMKKANFMVFMFLLSDFGPLCARNQIAKRSASAQNGASP